MSVFTIVLARRPISANKGPNARYTEALKQAARSKNPKITQGSLYARILWFHKEPTTQDVDNIAKRILDSLKGEVFSDDAVVSHCPAARIDATIDYELSGSPPSDTEADTLLDLLADNASRNVLYIEIGPRTTSAVNFGEVL